MTVKFAHIEDVLTGNTWDGPHGRVFYYNLVLDNGDKGNIGTKTQDSYSIGDALYYKLEQTDKGNKIKKASNDEIEAFKAQNGSTNGQTTGQQPLPQPTVKNFGGRGSNASFCLSYSKDLMIAAMPYHTDVTTNQWVEACLLTATKFHQWMQEHEQ